MENDITNESKEYLSKHYGMKRENKMKTLSLMYWIPIIQLHQDVIASPKSTLESLSKDITAIFKLIYK